MSCRELGGAVEAIDGAGGPESTRTKSSPAMRSAASKQESVVVEFARAPGTQQKATPPSGVRERAGCINWPLAGPAHQCRMWRRESSLPRSQVPARFDKE